MCISLPGKVISLKNKKALIDFSGKKGEASFRLVNVKVGDYVIIQQGFIIKKINNNQAKEILKMINL